MSDDKQAHKKRMNALEATYGKEHMLHLAKKRWSSQNNRTRLLKKAHESASKMTDALHQLIIMNEEDKKVEGEEVETTTEQVETIAPETEEQDQEMGTEGAETE